MKAREPAGRQFPASAALISTGSASLLYSGALRGLGQRDQWVALFILQKKMRGAVRIEIKNCPCLSASVVESNTIAEYKKQAVAFCFRIVEAKIHAAIIEHSHAAAFVA